MGSEMCIRDRFYTDGWITEPADIFTLQDRYGTGVQQLKNREGWGEKSADNLFQAIEEKRQIPLSRLLFSLGIRHVGEDQAKKLANHWRDIESLLQAARDLFEERQLLWRGLASKFSTSPSVRERPWQHFLLLREREMNVWPKAQEFPGLGGQLLLLAMYDLVRGKNSKEVFLKALRNSKKYPDKLERAYTFFKSEQEFARNLKNSVFELKSAWLEHFQLVEPLSDEEWVKASSQTSRLLLLDRKVLETLTTTEGVGPEVANSIFDFAHDERQANSVRRLLEQIEVAEPETVSYTHLTLPTTPYV